MSKASKQIKNLIERKQKLREDIKNLERRIKQARWMHSLLLEQMESAPRDIKNTILKGGWTISAGVDINQSLVIFAENIDKNPIEAVNNELLIDNKAGEFGIMLIKIKQKRGEQGRGE